MDGRTSLFIQLQAQHLINYHINAIEFTYWSFSTDPEVDLPGHRLVVVELSFQNNIAVPLVEFAVGYVVDAVGQEIFDLPNG